MKIVLASSLLIFLAVLANAEEQEGQSPHSVWPKKKVTYSDSYLPAVIQVLTYLLTRIDRVPGPLPPTPVEQPTLSVISIVSEAAPPPPNTTVTTEEPTTAPPEVVTMTADEQQTMPTPEQLRGVAEVIERIEGNFGNTEQEIVQVLHPTIAEIMLNKLRDILANEAKRRGFAKLQGYSDFVLEVLVETSNGTSKDQLETLLNLVLQNNDLKRRPSIIQVTHLLERLALPEGPLQRALENIPPMRFSL